MSDPVAHLPIAAVIAAAGRSTRMGRPKQLLPWGDSTVLATVACNLAAAGAAPVVCVVGHRAAEMTATLAGLPDTSDTFRLIQNAEYLHGEMLSSYRAGIAALLADAAPYAGTLLALGDQPHIPVPIIRQVLSHAQTHPDVLAIPSYTMRRGHPFYLPRGLWPELLALGIDDTLRTLLRRHDTLIRYVDVNTDAILRDIDTPADYQALAPTPS